MSWAELYLIKQAVKKHKKDTPGLSVAAPLTAGGIGAGLNLFDPGEAHWSVLQRLKQISAHNPIIGGAAMAAPILAGSAAAKDEGGAGRGAAVGAGTGAGLFALSALLGRLAKREWGHALTMNMASPLLSRGPLTVITAPALGAILGAIGGGIQKRRRETREEHKGRMK